MSDLRAEALREQVRRLRGGAGIELKPASAYEAVTRQMVAGLEEELREIKGRVNGLLWMVAGAMALDVAMRLVGG
jgi:hypothetical protein